MRFGLIRIAVIGLFWVFSTQTAWSAFDARTSDTSREAETGPQYEVNARGVIGPDITFCQLYGLKQSGRLGDIVGLTVATTSWNVGDEDVMWFSLPQPQHPFIVLNLYRLKNDRFEHIGQSWVKHGFFALGFEQCGGNCSYEPGHGMGDWLGQGCTDTYDANLNADQDGLGPRYEINPWTGGFTYEGSHLSENHSHDAIQHRLQVYDDDLDPAQNVGATYFAEGYYCATDDVNVMDSASWKPITVNGVPGGTWTFGMSSSGNPPTIGFALNTWTGSSQTELAQEVPPVEFVSPDGRCKLAVKVTDLGGGEWHYEYALLNIDMDRKVGFFTVPVTCGALVTNVGFHAAHSHDEPYSNDPWVAAHVGKTLTWSTVNNPVRWGTLYNFRFDANVPPESTTVTLGMYEPGDPATVIGTTLGPSLSASSDCNLNEISDCDDTSSGGSEDCNGNTTPDECEVPPLGPSDGDCNGNGIPDDCDLTNGANDCNGDLIPDDCQLAGNDCNANFIPDECDPVIVVISDDFETGSGWTVVSENIDSGEWELANPEDTITSGGEIAQPEDDYSPAGTLCFVTDATAGSTAGSFDVDEGPTHLISPAYDLSDGSATVEYAYWMFCDDGSDVLTVEVSNDDGNSWHVLTTHGSGESMWQTHSALIDDVVVTTATTRFRFSVSDAPNNSITEAAIDDLRVSIVDCTVIPPEECEGDANGDDVVDPLDYGYVLARFGCPVNTGDRECDMADVNGDGMVDPLDAGFVAARFGGCP